MNPDEQGPNRFRSIWLLFVGLWRLVRGEDGRGRKVRWLLGLLRPYRMQVGAHVRRRSSPRPPRRSLPRT